MADLPLPDFAHATPRTVQVRQYAGLVVVEIAKLVVFAYDRCLACQKKGGPMRHDLVMDQPEALSERLITIVQEPQC